MKEDIMNLIPTYPEAVSDVVLASHLGLIDTPYTWRRIKRGIRKLSNILSWKALENPNLMNRVEPLQPSTLEYLKENEMQKTADSLLEYSDSFLFSYYFLMGTNNPPKEK